MALGAIVNANSTPPDFNPTLNHHFRLPTFRDGDTEKKTGS
jgi:hypothetical protein